METNINLLPNTILCAVAYLNEVRIEVYLGSIIYSSCEGIINPANSNLAHNGGLAGLISSLAGPVLNKQCDAYIKKNRKLRTTEVLSTDSGDLSNYGIKKVIHAVGPIFKNFDINNNSSRDLITTIYNALVEANKIGLKSIAIPAVSCGIYLFPIKEASVCLVEGLISFISSVGKPKIKFVRFSMFTKEEAEAMLDSLLYFAERFDYLQIIPLPVMQNGTNTKFCGGCSSVYDSKKFSANKCCKTFCNFCVWRYTLTNCLQCKLKNYEVDFGRFIWCRQCNERIFVEDSLMEMCCRNCKNICFLHYIQGSKCRYCEHDY